MSAERPYPLDGAQPVPYECTPLGRLDSRYNLNKETSFNNHHYIFTARKMGNLAITQTWRDLAKNQVVMPKDIHSELHQMYDPPEVPDLRQIYDYVDLAYMNGEMLRYGSARAPIYKPISHNLMEHLKQEILAYE